jgi:hypothetical protein
MRCFMSLLLGIFTGVSCWAQVPRAAVSAAVPPLIRVSGTLPNMRGTVGVNFALYAEQTGGAPLWMESQNVTPNEKGRYTIYLGVNHASGVPLDLFASGEARWLGVQPEGQAEQARVELVSVPYALKAAKAADAETLGGYPLSAFVLAPSVNPSASTNSGSGGVKANDGGGGIMMLLTTVAGNSSYLAKFINETGDVENSLIYDTGSAVGVGTTNPAATLHVVSTSTAAGIVDVYSDTLTGVTFSTRSARGTPAAPAVVQAGDVIGGFTGKGWTGSGGFSGGRGALIIHANETWSSQAQSTYIQFNTTALGTNFQAERMRIDNAGNVGIGTASPTHTLDVNGTANFSGSVTVQGNVQVNGNLNVAGIQAGGIAGGIVTHGTPATSSAACTPPQMMYDSNYVYTCVAANSWRRTASAAF